MQEICSVDWKERKILSGWQERLEVAFQVASDVWLAYSQETGKGFSEKRKYLRYFQEPERENLTRICQFYSVTRVPQNQEKWEVNLENHSEAVCRRFEMPGWGFVFNCANTGNSIEWGIILNFYITAGCFASISHWILGIALHILVPWPVSNS